MFFKSLLEKLTLNSGFFVYLCVSVYVSLIFLFSILAQLFRTISSLQKQNKKPMHIILSFPNPDVNHFVCIQLHILDRSSIQNQTIAFGDSLCSLNIMFSRFVHATYRSFLWPTNTVFHYITIPFFVYQCFS